MLNVLMFPQITILEFRIFPSTFLIQKWTFDIESPFWSVMIEVLSIIDKEVVKSLYGCTMQSFQSKSEFPFLYLREVATKEMATFATGVQTSWQNFTKAALSGRTHLLEVGSIFILAREISTNIL